MIIFYIVQAILHAFTSSKTSSGKALDTFVLIVSLVVTFVTLGWTMLWVPFVVLIVGGGILGALVDAVRINKGR